MLRQALAFAALGAVFYGVDAAVPETIIIPPDLQPLLATHPPVLDWYLLPEDPEKPNSPFFKPALKPVNETSPSYATELRDLWDPANPIIAPLGKGGIATWAVVTNTEAFDVYAVRTDDKKEPGKPGEDIWWMGGRAFSKGPVSFLEYSNGVALTCWAFQWFETCKIKANTVMVVGSGADRNTANSDSGCDPISGWKAEQTAPPEFLQYLIRPEDIDKSQCRYGPITPQTQDLMASLTAANPCTTPANPCTTAPTLKLYQGEASPTSLSRGTAQAQGSSHDELVWSGGFGPSFVAVAGIVAAGAGVALLGMRFFRQSRGIDAQDDEMLEMLPRADMENGGESFAS